MHDGAGSYIANYVNVPLKIQIDLDRVFFVLFHPTLECKMLVTFCEKERMLIKQPLGHLDVMPCDIFIGLIGELQSDSSSEEVSVRV